MGKLSAALRMLCGYHFAILTHPPYHLPRHIQTGSKRRNFIYAHLLQAVILPLTSFDSENIRTFTAIVKHISSFSVVIQRRVEENRLCIRPLFQDICTISDNIAICYKSHSLSYASNCMNGNFTVILFIFAFHLEIILGNPTEYTICIQ